MNCFFNLKETQDIAIIKKYTEKWLFLSGCFETLRVVSGKIEFLDLHLARAKKTNVEIFKTFYDYSLLQLSLQQEVTRLCLVNKIYKIKIIFSDENIFYSIELLNRKMPSQIHLVSKDTSSLFTYHLTNHKLCDYAKYLDVLSTAGSAWDVVRTNGKEFLEGTKTNIYFCSKDQLITPRSGDLLSGIIRQRLIDLNLVSESTILLSGLGDFDGMLISNSLIGIQPVVSLDTCRFKNSHEYAKQLNKLFFS